METEPESIALGLVENEELENPEVWIDVQFLGITSPIYQVNIIM